MAEITAQRSEAAIFDIRRASCADGFGICAAVFFQSMQSSVRTELRKIFA
jgi:hypothetical protein